MISLHQCFYSVLSLLAIAILHLLTGPLTGERAEAPSLKIEKTSEKSKHEETVFHRDYTNTMKRVDDTTRGVFLTKFEVCG